MSSLTNTQINNTYPSLLKLSNSTTGITNTLQSVEDGLGGDTGLIIKQDYIGGSSLVPFTKKDTTQMAYGLGVINTGTAFPAGSHNFIYGQAFYDRGDITYSAITVGIGQITTTSDVVTFGIYSSQQTAQGIMPKDLLHSSFITLSGSEVTTLGLLKKTLPSNITLEEGGCYYILFVVTNPTLVTPTVRMAAPTSGMAGFHANLLNVMNGYMLAIPNTMYVGFQRSSTSSGQSSFLSTINGPLQSSYTTTSFVGNINNVQALSLGFVLHPVN